MHFNTGKIMNISPMPTWPGRRELGHQATIQRIFHTFSSYCKPCNNIPDHGGRFLDSFIVGPFVKPVRNFSGSVTSSGCIFGHKINRLHVIPPIMEVCKLFYKILPVNASVRSKILAISSGPAQKWPIMGKWGQLFIRVLV